MTQPMEKIMLTENKVEDMDIQPGVINPPFSIISLGPSFLKIHLDSMARQMSNTRVPDELSLH